MHVCHPSTRDLCEADASDVPHGAPALSTSLFANACEGCTLAQSRKQRARSQADHNIQTLRYSTIGAALCALTKHSRLDPFGPLAG
jgi:hypothetical protein